MSTFNFSRFARTLKWDFMQCRKEKLNLFLIITAAYSLFFILMLKSIMESDYSHAVSAMGGQIFAITTTLTLFVIPILHTKIGTPLNKEAQTRLNYLMLPATNREKFLSRFLLNTLLHLFIFVLAFLLADAIQYLYFNIIGAKLNTSISMNIWEIFNSAKLSEIIDSISKLDSKIIDSTAVFIGGYVMQLSFFLLAGVVFRKLAWIFGILIITTISTIVLPINSVTAHVIEGNATIVNFIYCGISFALSVAMLVLSYIVFKRLQLQSSKFLNI